MTHRIRMLLPALVAAGLAIAPVAAHAQSSQRGQPTRRFSTEDFGKLHWLEGTWEGTATGQSPFVERIHFLNDSTIELTFYGDAAMQRETGSGRVYLSVGRVFHTYGAGRWGATNVDEHGAFFVPQVNAHNTYAWTYESPDAWTATMRSGLGGQQRVTVYHMRRLSP